MAIKAVMEELKRGQRVKYKDENLFGTVIAVSQPPVKKHREWYSYYVRWDNGKLGVPSSLNIEKVEK